MSWKRRKLSTQRLYFFFLSTGPRRGPPWPLGPPDPVAGPIRSSWAQIQKKKKFKKFHIITCFWLHNLQVQILFHICYWHKSEKLNIQNFLQGPEEINVDSFLIYYQIQKMQKTERYKKILTNTLVILNW